MPKLSDAQQEQRRLRILDAAETSFAQNGFHRTTMQDICRKAGISAGALYLYFNSKESLIEGISSRLRDEVLDSFTKFSAAEDFLQGMAQTMEECILGQPLHKAQLLLEIASEATRNTSVAETMHRCDRLILGALTSILERAKAEGRIAPVLPIEEIVATMGIIADGLFWRRAVYPDFDLHAVADGVLVMMGALVRPVPVNEAGRAKNESFRENVVTRPEQGALS